jgi:hypothetical protein
MPEEAEHKTADLETDRSAKLGRERKGIRTGNLTFYELEYIWHQN